MIQTKMEERFDDIIKSKPLFGFTLSPDMIFDIYDVEVLPVPAIKYFNGSFSFWSIERDQNGPYGKIKTQKIIIIKLDNHPNLREFLEVHNHLFERLVVVKRTGFPPKESYLTLRSRIGFLERELQNRIKKTKSAINECIKKEEIQDFYVHSISQRCSDCDDEHILTHYPAVFYIIPNEEIHAELVIFNDNMSRIDIKTTFKRTIGRAVNGIVELNDPNCDIQKIVDNIMKTVKIYLRIMNDSH